jgi:hypothetical protein
MTDIEPLPDLDNDNDDAVTYSLNDLAALREQHWATAPACPTHYPKPCDCNNEASA